MSNDVFDAFREAVNAPFPKPKCPQCKGEDLRQHWRYGTWCFNCKTKLDGDPWVVWNDDWLKNFPPKP